MHITCIYTWFCIKASDNGRQEMNQLAVVACYQSAPFIIEYCDRQDVISMVSSYHCHSAILASEKEGNVLKKPQHEMKIKSSL